jgi:hypothetical protein
MGGRCVSKTGWPAAVVVVAVAVTTKGAQETPGGSSGDRN